MSVKKAYLTIEEPISRAEFIEQLHQVIVEYGTEHGLDNLKIPDRTSIRYKQYILDIFFNKYVFGKMYIPKSVPTNKLGLEVVIEHNYLIKDSQHKAKNGADCMLVLLNNKFDLIDRDTFYQRLDMVKTIQQSYPMLQGQITYLIAGSEGLQNAEERTLDNISDFPDLSDYYIKDLKNASKAFWDDVAVCVDNALGDLVEIYNNANNKIFKESRQYNPLAFAKSLYVYCQVLRYITDVPKIANRFVEMGKFIDGEKVKSIIMCYFNTDQNTGRNGKTYRMFGEEEYLQSNGFLTSNAGLGHTRLTDINVFKYNFFFKDEYAFRDTDSEFLKTINKNCNLRITANVLYRGECTVTNSAIFYLAAHNGKINSKLENNERCLTAIRFSDAKYEENKSNMTYIYDDIQDKTPIPEQDQVVNQPQAQYISEMYLDIKTMTMSELFDGLLKYSKGIIIPKALLTTKAEDQAQNALNISPELMELLSKSQKESNEISFVRLYTKLAKGQYYTNETAKQEVKKLYQFLSNDYPQFINRQSALNWDNKAINLSQEMLEALEEAIGNSVADTDYSILNQKELWLYILNMLNIDPNTSISDLHTSQSNDQ